MTDLSTGTMKAKPKGELSMEELAAAIQEMEEMATSMKALLKTQQQSPKEGDSEVIEWNTPFEETAFDFLYIMPIWSYGFWYGILVYVLQIMTISLTLMDILGPKDNRLRVPPMVDLTVTWAQGIAVLMAEAFQTDLTDSARKLQNGFHPGIQEEFPGATRFAWLLACLAQLLSGLLLLTTIFILTMQEEDVLSIMLNFAALHFMAEIDYCGFKIAKLGFVNETLQKEALAIANFHVPKRKQGFKNRLRRLIYYSIMAGLLLSFAFLKELQFRGVWLYDYVHLEFRGARSQPLSKFDGVLQVVERRNIHQKRRYTAKTKNKRTLWLSYCDAEEAWTLSLTEDPCSDFFARSPQSFAYDVTAFPDKDWKVVDIKSGELRHFGDFSLVGRDVEPGTCQGSWCYWYSVS